MRQIRTAFGSNLKSRVLCLLALAGLSFLLALIWARHANSQTPDPAPPQNAAAQSCPRCSPDTPHLIYGPVI